MDVMIKSVKNGKLNTIERALLNIQSNIQLLK